MNKTRTYQQIILLFVCTAILCPTGSLFAAGLRPSQIIKEYASMASTHHVTQLPELLRGVGEVSPLTRIIQKSFASVDFPIVNRAAVFRVGRQSETNEIKQVVAISITKPLQSYPRIFLLHYTSLNFNTNKYIQYLNVELRDYSEMILGPHRAADLMIKNGSEVPDLIINGVKLKGTNFTITGLEHLMPDEIKDVLDIIANGKTIPNLNYELY